jgi:dipeptidyl-peptidase 4
MMYRYKDRTDISRDCRSPIHAFTSRGQAAAITSVQIFLLMISTSQAASPNEETQRLLAEIQPQIHAIYQDRAFAPSQFNGQWLPDSSGYTYQERDPRTNRLVEVSYEVPSGRLLKETVQKDDQKIRQPSMSPDGKWSLEVQDRNLFLRGLPNQEMAQVTDASSHRDVSYRGLTWSPDSTHAVFVEVDATAVRRRPVLIPEDPSYPGVAYHRFARVGEKIDGLQVGLVGTSAKQTKWLPLETHAEGFYLGQLEWAGNSNEIVVETMSRFRDKRDFLLVTLDGQITKIYSETNEAWAISAQGKNSGLKWVRNGDAFIVVTEKDGWRHAYLHSRVGKELSLLTPGPYDIIDRSNIDEKGGWYYFYASPDNATQKYLYRVPLDGSGVLERITPQDQPGTHDYRFSPDARWAFHTYSSLNSPPVVELVELPEHRIIKVLEDNEALRKKVEPIVNPVELLQLDISDTKLDAWLIKPKDFDETKKYPVFVYVYGEPYSQTVLDTWGSVHIDFHRAIADLGYLVVSIDNRGTPAPKGAAWRRAVFGSLGPLSTEDQAAALKALGHARSYVDLSRVGIWGWSGGGSNTLNALFREPELYHVGIAVVPKPQPHLYNAWFQEIYMRTREVNPDGYERSAPINFAEGLQGKLLIVTGSGETNTHIQIIEGLVDRLVELGKAFDYMVYPNRDHGLREGPGTEVHVRMLVVRYLLEHLPHGPR